MQLDHIFYNDQGVFFDPQGYGLLLAQRVIALVNENAIAPTSGVLITWIDGKERAEVRVSAPSQVFEKVKRGQI